MAKNQTAEDYGIDLWSLEQIHAEHWRKAKGVFGGPQETNAALSERHYGVACEIPHKIGVIKGYWIWWCSTHHQPSSHCERAKAEIRVREFAEAIMNADKTSDYEYGGEKALNSKKEKPPKGTRWLTPRELARDFINEIKK